MKRKKIIQGRFVFQSILTSELPEILNESVVFAQGEDGEMFAANRLAHSAPDAQTYYVSFGELPHEDLTDRLAQMQAEISKLSMELASYALAARRAKTAEALEYYRNARTALLVHMADVAEKLHRKI